MTKFQIRYEQGYIRRMALKAEQSIEETPWFLDSSSGVPSNKSVSLVPTIIDDRGNEQQLAEPDKGTLAIPIYTPLLAIPSDFENASRYEYDLFLDRLEMVKRPEIYGAVYDPSIASEQQLEELINFQPSIISIRLAPLFNSSYREWLEKLMQLRNSIPPDIAIYLPRTGMIGYNTLLVALGIDILDNTEARLLALEQISFWDNFISHDIGADREKLKKINTQVVYSDFEGIKKAVLGNTIWTRLYREMHVSPKVSSAIKHFNRIAKPYSMWGFQNSNKVEFIGDEGLHHPEVKAFQQRVKTRYKFPPNKKILLLLPCSAKKPYSQSKSHRIYQEAIRKALKQYTRIVEIWSLTSPLGVVPNELETVYPARSYDIPVTGEWSEEESKLTGALLGKMLDKVPKGIPILVHVSEGYRDMLNLPGHNYITSWQKSKPTSKAAIDSLIECLKEYCPEEKIHFDSKARQQDWINSLQALIYWNHGTEFKIPLDKLKFFGRSPKPIAVQRNKTHYLTWEASSGKVRLFPEAVLASNLKTSAKIIFDGEDLRGSTLFLSGIKTANSQIAPGDEVIIFDETGSEPLAIGDASISGETMNRAANGIGVKIRKKIKKQEMLAK